MTSLIAQFFRKNVALNMKATDEKTPQTVRGVASVDLGDRWKISVGGGTESINKETVENGVWNLPQGYSRPYTPFKDTSKTEEKNSLLAEFFRKTVTLNKGATVESSPQTAYEKPWYDRVSWTLPSTYQEWTRQYVSPKVDDYRRTEFNPILPESASFDTRYEKGYPRCDVSIEGDEILVEISLSYGRRCGVRIDRRAAYTIGQERAIMTVLYQVVKLLNAYGMEVKDINDMVRLEMSKYFSSR